MADADCYVVSIEVDGRQAYIFETDRLREMLGASRLLQQTVSEARDLFTEGDGLHLYQPVSGEIRVWAESSDRLLRQTWRMRKWLSERGIEHTVGLWKAEKRHFCDFAPSAEPDIEKRKQDKSRPSLEGVQGDIGARVASLKGRKPGFDARPNCSLFAPCQIHGHDYATEWRAGENADKEDKRRNLRGERAKWKLKEWEADKKDFFHTDLYGPSAEIRNALARVGAVTTRPIQFDHLSDADFTETGDQFIAFICADGDGMGSVLTRVDWNDPELKRNADDRPWKVNHDFAAAFDDLAHSAYRNALQDLLEKHLHAFEKEAGKSKSGAIKLPILPQLLGGDDLWTVCRRRYALEFCRRFGEQFALLAQGNGGNPVIKDVVESTGSNINNLTISMGVAFAKAGHPAHAMLEAAEALLRSAKTRRKSLPSTAQEGCIDWHWIDSTLSQSISEARRTGWRYADGDKTFLLTTRPWTLSECTKFLEASESFSRKAGSSVARRKREQLQEILRRGAVLSSLAWESWLKSLKAGERDTLAATLSLIESKTITRSEVERGEPWFDGPDGKTTRWLDLLSLDDVLATSDDESEEEDQTT